MISHSLFAATMDCVDARQFDIATKTRTVTYACYSWNWFGHLRTQKKNCNKRTTVNVSFYLRCVAGL